VDSETNRKSPSPSEPGAWLDDSARLIKEKLHQESNPVATSGLTPQDQSKLLEFLGLINLKILTGISLYLEVDGATYKVLHSVYWRSVFTGIEHYLLRCEEIADGMWMEGSDAPIRVDLAIRYTEDGWLVKNCSLRFMMYRS
jgi:Ni,Fe-hydrogenase I cytochrome b subunit